MKKPPRLIPFNEEDVSYFEDWKTSNINEKFRCIDMSFDYFIKSSEYQNTCNDMNPVRVSVTARSLRISVREFQHYLKRLTKHLEQIEVTGEWK
jgi:hypothetical protein